MIVARDQTELDSTAAELKQSGIEVLTIAKDLSQRQAPFDVYQDVKAKGISIDVFVNDAGQGQYGLFVDTDINRELDMIQLNIGNANLSAMLLYDQDQDTHVQYSQSLAIGLLFTL